MDGRCVWYWHGGMNTFGVRVIWGQHLGFKNPGLLNEPLWGIAGTPNKNGETETLGKPIRGHSSSFKVQRPYNAPFWFANENSRRQGDEDNLNSDRNVAR